MVGQRSLNSCRYRYLHDEVAVSEEATVSDNYKEVITLMYTAIVANGFHNASKV